MLIPSKLQAFILLMLLSCTTSHPLFRETTPDWRAHGDADWTFSGNELTGSVEDGVGFVMTEEKYDDFELELEFYPDSTINSGVFVRCVKVDINPTDCYEFNIWDLHPDQDNRTGTIVTKGPPLAYLATNYQWNTYRIRAEDNRMRAWVNGELTADLVDDVLEGGYIGLQASGTGVVRFRGVRIKAL